MALASCSLLLFSSPPGYQLWWLKWSISTIINAGHYHDENFGWNVDQGLPAASEAKARPGPGWAASLVSQKPSKRQMSVPWEDQSSENQTYMYVMWMANVTGVPEVLNQICRYSKSQSQGWLVDQKYWFLFTLLRISGTIHQSINQLIFKQSINIIK